MPQTPPTGGRLFNESCPRFHTFSQKSFPIGRVQVREGEFGPASITPVLAVSMNLAMTMSYMESASKCGLR